jgi:hypothetical protein
VLVAEADGAPYVAIVASGVGGKASMRCLRTAGQGHFGTDAAMRGAL